MQLGLLLSFAPFFSGVVSFSDAFTSTGTSITLLFSLVSFFAADASSPGLRDKQIAAMATIDSAAPT
eukprot:CAMPEP_0170179386 /NCGR_PEP_ID=MMETSP0040_2-20121228/17449_1 /TAXON_ID=641309 /ORGANISM="Lotharella oceanica, Strain CCMP622" /LENGTH=66 /DNA_ID=CAMNT_0010423421 /DNA_START=198 /DNA_END=398 /DNA_ORIENTATION=+